ncbi:MAG: hypothetical protein Q8L39_13255 [Burkholderiales bacterium]|nr:hypothetical protein [Burkholderiales bacterium]
MDRAYKSGASGTPPTVPVSPSPGYPISGDPQTAIPATKPGPYWYHMIMEEMMAIVIAGAITPAIGTLTQVRDALYVLFARLGVANTWSKAQRGAVIALTDGATITPDFALSNNYEVTLAGNRILANPTNIVAGQSGVIKIAQDATGTRTLAFGSYWKFEGGIVTALTTTTSAIDDLVYYVESATRIVGQLKVDTK